MEPLTVGPEGDVFVGRFGGGLRWWFHYLRKRFLDKIHKMDKILRKKLTQIGAIVNCGGNRDHGVWLENLPIYFVAKMHIDFAGGWSSCSVQCFVNAAGATFSGSSSRAFCVLSFNRFFRVKEYFFGSLLA